MLYFVEHTDPMLRGFYLFTDEKEPNLYGSYLCFLVERKTLYLGEYKGQSRVQIKSKYVKRLIPEEEFPTEGMWGNLEMEKIFESTMKLIYENI